MNYFFKTLYLTLFCILTTLTTPLNAKPKSELIFEGYYKILSGKVHIGYIIQRYQYFPKKKQFSSTYYIETNALGGNTKESIKALSDNYFHPISYSYTAQLGKATQIIDAQFEQKKGSTFMNAVIRKGKKTEKIHQLKLPKNTFLSTFLGFKLLQKKFKMGSKFKYSAIAEEDAHVYTGHTWIKKEETFLNQKALRILNTFKNTRFISFVTKEGEVLGSKSPLQQLETQLVSSPHIATKNFQLDMKVLKQLFGYIPTGKKNILAQSQGKN